MKMKAVSAFIQFNASKTNVFGLDATLSNMLLQTLVIVLDRPQCGEVAWTHGCKEVFSPSLF
jgi:hypothetical protein